MATWADVEARGYKTAASSPGVRYVYAEGFSNYIGEDDQETIDALANPPDPTPVVEPPPAAVVPQLAKTASLADVIAAVNAWTKS